MKLTLSKSSDLDDWYLIERAEHDGKEWMEPAEHGFSFRRSARLGVGRENVDIEGTLGEMRAVAKAILDNSGASFKRVGVEVANGFVFSSPRNSDEGVFVEKADAVELAKQILGLSGAEESPEGEAW